MNIQEGFWYKHYTRTGFEWRRCVVLNWASRAHATVAIIAGSATGIITERPLEDLRYGAERPEDGS